MATDVEERPLGVLIVPDEDDSSRTRKAERPPPDQEVCAWKGVQHSQARVVRQVKFGLAVGDANDDPDRRLRERPGHDPAGVYW